MHDAQQFLNQVLDNPRSGPAPLHTATHAAEADKAIKIPEAERPSSGAPATGDAEGEDRQSEQVISDDEPLPPKKRALNDGAQQATSNKQIQAASDGEPQRPRKRGRPSNAERAAKANGVAQRTPRGTEGGSRPSRQDDSRPSGLSPGALHADFCGPAGAGGQQVEYVVDP